MEPLLLNVIYRELVSNRQMNIYSQITYSYTDPKKKTIIKFFLCNDGLLILINYIVIKEEREK